MFKYLEVGDTATMFHSGWKEPLGDGEVVMVDEDTVTVQFLVDIRREFVFYRETGVNILSDLEYGHLIHDSSIGQGALEPE